MAYLFGDDRQLRIFAIRNPIILLQNGKFFSGEHNTRLVELEKRNIEQTTFVDLVITSCNLYFQRIFLITVGINFIIISNLSHGVANLNVNSFVFIIFRIKLGFIFLSTFA